MPPDYDHQAVVAEKNEELRWLSDQTHRRATEVQQVPELCVRDFDVQKPCDQGRLVPPRWRPRRAPPTPCPGSTLTRSNLMAVTPRNGRAGTAAGPGSMWGGCQPT